MKPLILVISLTIPLILAADTILDDFQVNTEFPGHPPQKSPYAAARWETETIYVTWLSQRDGVHWDVACNRFNYDLEPLGDAFYLNEPLGVDDCIAPRLALSTAGFGSAWIEDASPHRMMFRSYDDNGNPFCSPVSVAEGIGAEIKDSLSIAALTDGYLLVWYDERDDSRIWAQKVDFDGDLIGANIPIRTDSSGSILGLEAQNHPDGRLLVSWVTDQMYSRGRWLDDTGAFLGDVFDMAEPYIDDFLVRSMARIEPGGTGLLYQYSGLEVLGCDDDWVKYSYMSYFNTSGTQVGERFPGGFWESDWGEGQSTWGYEINSYPDVIYIDESNYISIRYSYYREWEINTIVYCNKLYSTLFGDYIVPWGLTPGEDTDLCRLSDESVLYNFSQGQIGLRTYNISTLDSSAYVAWIAEPDFGLAQDQSDICIEESGAFRIIYINHLGAGESLYTRYFDETGIPAADDTVASVNFDQLPPISCGGKIQMTGEDEAVVIWNDHEDIRGTTYIRDSWNGEVERVGCSPDVVSSCKPHFDINSQNNMILIWTHTFISQGVFVIGQEYFQSYSLLFNPISAVTQFGNNMQYHIITDEFDIALRNDGRFLLCWCDLYFSSALTVQAGIGYNTLLAEPLRVGYYYASKPTLETTMTGYSITWIEGTAVYLISLDSDGNLLGDAQVINSTTESGVGSPDLAVSDSSGNFAVCWQDQRHDEGDIYCRQFNPDGSYYGREYRVNSDPVGPKQCEPAVAFGPNDQLYFTWTDFRNEGGQGDIFCKVIEWEDATAVEPENEPAPYTFALHQPYPNPFNPTTTISFEIPVAGLVKLEVFDVNGRRVGVGLVTNGNAYGAPTRHFDAGIHHILFDGSDLSSGIYFVRLQAGEFRQTQKLVLLK